MQTARPTVLLQMSRASAGQLIVCRAFSSRTAPHLKTSIGQSPAATVAAAVPHMPASCFISCTGYSRCLLLAAAALPGDAAAEPTDDRQRNRSIKIRRTSNGNVNSRAVLGTAVAGAITAAKRAGAAAHPVAKHGQIALLVASKG